MAEITDFDALIAPPKRVKLEGTWYELPADIPLELMLAIGSAEAAQGEEGIAGMRAQMLKLFQIHQPKLTALPGTLTDLVTLVPLVYGSPSQKKAIRQMRSPTGSRKSPRKPAAAKRRSRSST